MWLRLFNLETVPPSGGVIGERNGKSSGPRAVNAQYGAFVNNQQGTQSAQGEKQSRSNLAALSKLRQMEEQPAAATPSTTTARRRF